MDVPKQIPAQDVTVDVQSIKIDIDDRSATVILRIDDEKESVKVDLLPIYQPGTSTQKQTIKAFLRQIVASSLELDVSEIPYIFN